MTEQSHGVGEPVDFRASRAARRQSWYGLKKHAKRWLSMRLPHLATRTAASVIPSLKRRGRLPAPVGLREVLGRAGGAQFVMLSPDRCVVAKELYWGNGRRPRAEDDFAVQLFARWAEHADVVFDIGAYTGLFTLVATAVNPSLRVHAFEMLPDVHRALSDNCERNGVLDRVVLHRAAVGAAGSSVTVPARSAGSALADFYSTRLHFDSGVAVPTTSLDELAGSVSGRVLLKVDVEGTENEVFHHGQAFLEAHRPTILCEVLHDVADPDGLQALLAPLGYRFYLIQERELLRFDRIEPDARFRDWLFTTETPAELALPAV